MNKQRFLRPGRLLFALIFLTGFILIFSDVRGKVDSLFYELFTSWQFIPSVLKFIEMPQLLTAGFIFILLITFLWGRIYCSWVCPFGIMQDMIGFIRSKLPFKKRHRKFKRAINYLRYPILGLLIVSIFFTGIFGIIWLDPYSNFGRIVLNLYQPVYIAIHNSISSLLMNFGIYSIQPLHRVVLSSLTFFSSAGIFIIITILVLYGERIYCNTICPVGTLLGLISRFSFHKIQIDKSGCTSCGRCQRVCKADCINIKNQEIDESRCISCFNCISSCEVGGINLQSVKFRKSESISVTNRARRNFLKAGVLTIGTMPVIANVSKYVREGKINYNNRGPLSPPGSISHEHLKDRCIACELCISSCPSNVLQPSFMEYGFTGMMLPKFDSQKGFCNYECTKCSEVCPTGALLPLNIEEKKLTQVGRVFFQKDICVVKTKEKSCGSCSEHCPTQAVYMVPYKDYLTIPEINTEICVGCAACEHVCPVEKPHPAIFVVSNAIHQRAKKPVSHKIEMRQTDEFPF